MRVSQYLLVALRQHDPRQRRIHHRRPAAVADVGDHFHAHPRAGKPRQRDRHRSVVENILRVGRIEERNADVVEAEVALVGDGRAFRNMIVAGQHQRRAVVPVPARLAWRKMSPERSTPGPLPYQMPRTPSTLVLPTRFDNLAAHRRSGRQILVYAGLKMDVVFVEKPLRAQQRQIVAAERRAFVPGNKRARFQAGAAVPPHLIERQTHQRLDAGEIDRPFFERVFIG